MRDRCRGATLLETVVVLAILGLVLLAASAPISRSAGIYDLERGVWEVRSLLNQARVRSIWEGVATRLRIGRQGYAMDRYDDASKAWRVVESGAWERFTVEANNTPTYHPTGSVTGMATIVVSNARGGYRLTLAITGRIKAKKI